MSVGLRRRNQLKAGSHRFRNPAAAGAASLFEEIGRNFDRDLLGGVHADTISRTSIRAGLVEFIARLLPPDEPYVIPAATAALVSRTKQHGGRGYRSHEFGDAAFIERAVSGGNDIAELGPTKIRRLGRSIRRRCAGGVTNIRHVIRAWAERV
jgi:hypothetical protein